MEQDHPRLEPQVECLPWAVYLLSNAKIYGEISALIDLAIHVLLGLGFELSVAGGKWQITEWGFMDSTAVDTLALLWWAAGQAVPSLAHGLERDARIAYSMDHGEDASFLGAYSDLNPEIAKRNSIDYGFRSEAARGVSLLSIEEEIKTRYQWFYGSA